MRDTVQVLYDATDISTSVVKYDRDKAICTGIGSMRLDLKISAPITPQLFHTITLYEDGNKKGTYFIHTIDRTNQAGTLTLSCQDGSLKLQDYFIAETYYIDYPSASDYWIKKFCDEALVDYSFDGVSTGTLLSNNTSLGIATAMDTIVPLLQQNGWYLYFDGDNVAHFGRVAVDTSTFAATLTDSEIISINTISHDRMFRNRALVWGNGNASKGTQVIAEIDNHGRYDNEYPGGNDVRSVVIANSNIKTKVDAFSIAAKAIKEFENASFEIYIDVAGAWDLEVGDYIYCNSRFLSRGGMITTIGSSMSDAGLITHIVLNQRCPRLFAFYDIGGRIYVGTDRAGVWRKPLKYIHTWENYSTGITDLHITDLAVDNSNLATVTYNGHAYLRNESESAWTRFQPVLKDTISGLGDEVITTYPAASGRATTCTFDKKTGESIVGFTLVRNASGDPTRSWIVYANGPSSYHSYQLHDEVGETGYEIVDIDNNSTENLASVIANYSGVYCVWNNDGYTGSYGLTNTEQYLYTPVSGVPISGVPTSGYLATEIRDGKGLPFGIHTGSNLGGDGKYVYDIRTKSSFSSTNEPDYSTLTIYEYDTVISGAITTYRISGYDDALMYDADFSQIVGERTVVVPYNNEQDEVGVLAYNFRNKTVSHYDTGVKGLLLSTVFAIHRGERRVYMLIQPNNLASVRIYYYDVDEDRVHQIASEGVPTTKEGGTYENCYHFMSRGYVLQNNYIAFPFGATYSNVPIEDVTVSIEVPYILFHKLGTTVGSLNTSPASVLKSNGGMAALMQWDFYCGGGVDQDVSLAFGYDTDTEGYKYMIAKFSVLGAGDLLDAGFYNPLGCFGNRERLFFLQSEGGTVVYTYNIINGDTGLKNKFFLSPHDPNEILVLGELDEVYNQMYYYSYSTGDIYAIPVASGDTHQYNIGIHPSTTPYEGSDCTGFRGDAGLINDKFFVNAYSEFFVDGITVVRNATFQITPPISGARMSTADYMHWARDNAMLMKGQTNTEYIQVLDTNKPFHVDSSLTSPFAVYGNTAFSGLVISGIQTGWNQGQLYVSDTGDEDTFTRVLLFGYKSFVSDVREFMMMSGLENAEDDMAFFHRYMMYPQPTEEVITLSGTTELCLLDLTTIDPNSVIISSGTLGRGEIYRVFSGYLNHLEVTNTQDVPYMFVSLSGIPPTFYQKDSSEWGELENDFVDRTNNLPQANITIIRADDLI